MNFFCSCFFEHLDDICTGRSTDDGIIYHNNTLAPYNLFNNIQFDLHTGLSLTLFRLDKGSSYITVLVECHTVRDSGIFRISFCRNQSGIRHTDNQISLYRIRLCKSLSCNNPCMIYIDVVDHAVHTRKINVLKNTTCLLFRWNLHTFVRRYSMLCKADNLSRFHITDKVCTNCCKGTAFRCQEPGIISLADTEWFETKWISRSDHLTRA